MSAMTAMTRRAMTRRAMTSARRWMRRRPHENERARVCAIVQDRSVLERRSQSYAMTRRQCRMRNRVARKWPRRLAGG